MASVPLYRHWFLELLTQFKPPKLQCKKLIESDKSRTECNLDTRVCLQRYYLSTLPNRPSILLPRLRIASLVPLMGCVLLLTLSCSLQRVQDCREQKRETIDLCVPHFPWKLTTRPGNASSGAASAEIRGGNLRKVFATQNSKTKLELCKIGLTFRVTKELYNARNETNLRQASSSS